MRIRTAAENDFATVTELLEKLGRPRVTSQNYAACRQIYVDQLADPDSEMIVAVDDSGALVGFCSIHFRNRLNYAVKQTWVSDLIVDRRARGRGTARALLDQAEKLGAERGCDEVTLESDYGSSEAHLLYTAAGMQDAGKSFRKPIQRG